MLRLRMSGAIPLLPVHDFKAWTGTILPSLNPLEKEACFLIPAGDAELSAEL
jgi:hypothetical protein